MHLSSLEVRWFWKGEVETHPGLKSVFERFEPIEKRSDVKEVRWSKAREDVYLIVPSAEDLGIKWREGELQTKGRRGAVSQGKASTICCATHWEVGCSVTLK